MTPWTNPESYAPRTFVHPHVDAVIDEIRAIRREHELEIADEPSGVWGWIITGLCVFAMGVTIALQIGA